MVELTLAMGFVSVLLLAVAMTVMQIGNIYDRGITLKEVDQIGRSIASEFQRNISGGAPFELITCTASTPSCNYADKTWGGRLCIGQYSYIWNYGDTLKAASPTSINKYQTSSKKIRLVKVIDANADYCNNLSRDIKDSDAVELMDQSQHDLALHSFKISNGVVDDKTGQRIYTIEFLLGTNDQAAINYISGSNVACKTPSSVGADPTYCSINKFNILVRTGNISG